MFRRLVGFCGPMLVCGCNGIGVSPGSVSLLLEWDPPPTEKVYVWVRVEERADVKQPGPILSSTGPAEYTPGEPQDLTLNEVPNGEDRVVVVEVREAANANLRVLYYGISEPFTLDPGKDTVVDVPVKLKAPESEVSGASVKLLFGGVEKEAVGPGEIGSATLRTRSRGATSLVVANDASFSSNLRTVALAQLACTSEKADGETWDLCDLEGWDLTAGSGQEGDGLYWVFRLDW